ncbi:arylesterase [Pedobacter fastidiosus]|uniref:Arylesterase n=1 Tax=Pedobacter fastidiosus TaxID=2765361 RepID=A0ABR7KYC7_9SPHI|nr:arylesterase [Pedobacter fastidiosus]MBC6113126.1 arylesterase [Pedobacter fastidiosus]
MLRKRLMGLFVLAVVLASCGNGQNKTDKDKTLDSVDDKSSKTEVKQKNILFFGTSLTAGYGLDPTEAYPALIQNRIDSLKLPYKVINGGLSGETSAAGKARIDWLLKQPVDIFVLELGANDGLRGLPVAETTKNLQAIIDRVKAKYPDAKMVLAGMQVPPNMGAKYAADFKNMFPALASKNKMLLIPFLLDKVGGVPKLNQADGIHPTAEGDKILAENVWVVLKDLLK